MQIYGFDKMVLFGLFFFSFLLLLLSQLYPKKVFLKESPFSLENGASSLEGMEFWDTDSIVFLRKLNKPDLLDAYWVEIYKIVDFETKEKQLVESFLANASAKELWLNLKTLRIQRKIENLSESDIRKYFGENSYFLKSLDSNQNVLKEIEIGRQQYGVQNVYIREIRSVPFTSVYLVENLAPLLDTLKQASLKLMQRNFFDSSSFFKAKSIVISQLDQKILELTLREGVNLYQGVSLDAFIDLFELREARNKDKESYYINLLKNFFKFKISRYLKLEDEFYDDGTLFDKDYKISILDGQSQKIYQFNIQCKFLETKEPKKFACRAKSNWSNALFDVNDSLLLESLQEI